MNTFDELQKLIYGLPSEELTRLTFEGQEVIVHHKVKQPLLRLLSTLKDAQLTIKIISHWRSFEHQSIIWNSKWSGQRPLLDRHSQVIAFDNLNDEEKFNAICFWSALPGTSRHHWGTDFDIFLQEPINCGYQPQLVPEEFSQRGECHLLETWLQSELERFGFYRPYQSFNGGVSPEPWHISFKSIAADCQKKLKATDVAYLVKQHKLFGEKVILEKLNNYLEQYVYSVD